MSDRRKRGTEEREGEKGRGVRERRERERVRPKHMLTQTQNAKYASNKHIVA